MSAKFLTTTCLIATIGLTPVVSAPVAAQDARDLFGAAVLGITALAIANGAANSQPSQPAPSQPRPQPPRATPSTSGNPGAAPRAPRSPAIPSTEQGRQAQTALNYFGFDAGYVDGQVGPSTRAAIERYQAAMGYPINGQNFPEDQARYLTGAYLWATNGGAQQRGLSGVPLLHAYQDVLNGQTQTAGAPIIVNPAPVTVVAAGGETTASAGPGTVPNIFAGQSTDAALSDHCNAVALQSQANGGQMTLGNLANPAIALSEQFCNARGNAIATARDLADATVGFTWSEITDQCVQFSGAVSGQVQLIATVPPTQAELATRGFAIGTGIPQSDLAATSRVCLGVGYAEDNMQMALGAALILVSTGEQAYGELLAHHLREGFGLNEDAQQANAWYQSTLAAFRAGALPVFSPNDPGRLPLIQQAVAGSLVPQPQPVNAASPSAVVPIIPVPSTNGGAEPVFAPQVTPAPIVVQPAPVSAPAPAPAPVPVQDAVPGGQIVGPLSVQP